MGEVRDPERDQPLPISNERRPIVDVVRDDLLDRKEHGIRKYGQALQSFNGRDPVRDAYEESVDRMLYLKQLLEENAALTRYEMYHNLVWCKLCDDVIRSGNAPESMHGTRIFDVIELIRHHEREFHSNG